MICGEIISSQTSVISVAYKSYIENGYVKMIKETEGNSLKEKTINFLLKKGVKQQDINVVQEMMLKNED